ncbi:hypothetical protein AX16_007443 [Volvariella volvacea WC 439]|nr:hypothetical protein AX16_007443 [Volvariella volvacea WC 439]
MDSDHRDRDLDVFRAPSLPTTPRSSTSSAIDLTRTPSGIAAAATPSSPALVPSDRHPRRRTSWENRLNAQRRNNEVGGAGGRGLIDTGQDPLSLGSTTPVFASHPLSFPLGTSAPTTAASASVIGSGTPNPAIPTAKDNLASFTYPSPSDDYYDDPFRDDHHRTRVERTAPSIQDERYSGAGFREYRDGYAEDYGHQHGDMSHYTSSFAHPSTTSLINPRAFGDGDIREDDEAHLTSNMSGVGFSPKRDHGIGSDDDSIGAGVPAHSLHANTRTPHSRFGTKSPNSNYHSSSYTPTSAATRYNLSPSPLRKTGTVLKTMSASLRRISSRVANVAGAGLENQIRLLDPPVPEAGPSYQRKEDDREGGAIKEEPKTPQDGERIPDLRSRLPIRGRTLGFLGMESKLRLVLYKILVHPWTEPVILVLIIAHAVILTIQAAPTLTLPTPDGDDVQPRVVGYFQTWEDYALFTLFIIFTVEAFARICVSGFLLDPEVPVSTLFTLPFTLFRADTYNTSTHPPGPSNHTYPPNASTTSISRQNTLARGMSFTRRLQRLNQQLRSPFVLNTTRTPAPEYHPTPVRTEESPPPHVGNLEKDGIAGDGEKVPIPPLMAKSTFDSGMSGSTLLNQSSSPGSGSASGPYQTFSSMGITNINHGGIPHPNTKSKSDSDLLALPFKLSIDHMHNRVTRNVPYLRHSWGRIDFVSIIGFWITFILAEMGLERGGPGGYHIGIFRAISVIRTARLLTITAGTTTIMHSLKTARPLLTSVAYFVLFAMILFSIIGVQSFKGSLRRNCFLQPTLGEEEIQLEQFCGGYIDPTTLEEIGFVQLDGSNSDLKKGYICPLGQVCREGENPNDNVESFDTIWYAALQVIITASANGWTPLMYNMIDSEFFISCFFFIICVIVLNFWLINLFVAVITNTFGAIRSETKKSAFAATSVMPITDDQAEDSRNDIHTRQNFARTFYKYTEWFWVVLALFSLSLQASRTDEDLSDLHEAVLYYGELIITILFDVEIIIRILATLPDWRSFFRQGKNWLDLVLAVGSTIIQIPAIMESEVYPWFTIFQLARFYRFILVVPRMRPLLVAVFSNVYGLVNMSLFVLMINYIAALAAVQFLRGDFDEEVTTNFGQLFTSFLAIYQIFSSENWTDVLYESTHAEIQLGQTVIVAIFTSAWMLFSNFIVLQMFIAVINENFDIAEEAKRERQRNNYLEANAQAQKGKNSWLKRLNPYHWVKANPVSVNVDNLPPHLVLPMQRTVVQGYDLGQAPTNSSGTTASSERRRRPRHNPSKSLTLLQRLFAGQTSQPTYQLQTFRREQAAEGEAEDNTRPLELLPKQNERAPVSEEANDAFMERRHRKADFILNHPTYDKTFWIFPQTNPIRKFCQKLVRPANGDRIFGTPYSPIAHPIFQLTLLLVVIGGIVVEGIANPIYRRNYFGGMDHTELAWFDLAEIAFGVVLSVEFLIKVIADGFAFTPNAYLKSIWNIFDFFILLGLVVNVTTSLVVIGGVSRLTRSLKALRALRLITLIDRMRSAFENLIISGLMRIFDAAILAVLYMIPYAVWGLNIFAGKMNMCNDDSVEGIGDCVGEFVNSPFDGQFAYPVPRVWDNPAPSTVFSFDSFKDSLLILFEIVSLEGWIDVLGIATSITGVNSQPQTNASQFYAIYFLVYHLMGGVVILTLFISIIIGNFSAKTGSAYLTTPQREWIDLKKLFKRQRPSKRPLERPTGSFRAWCFDKAIRKHGWWSRTMTFIFIFHIFALMTQTFTTQVVADTLRNDVFLVIMAIYLIDVSVRLYGLGWTSFHSNGWNLFDVIVSVGSFITTLIVRSGSDDFVIEQLQKLFLVSIAFKLVQRTDSLNMLFKTAVASLPVIFSLLGLWLILFIFFAILFVEVFGMTKWGSGETRNMNYNSIGNALVMLTFMSAGEGWNQYMHDYTIEWPRCTNSSPTQPDSDCGSKGWAFTLFIAWNVLSMYIFVNMFTGVVVENFSYVYQTSSGGAKAITRGQMRAFKKVWGEMADPGDGYLKRENYPRFFGKLSGVFEVRIYPEEYSIKNITERCRKAPFERPYEHNLDIAQLKKILNEIDYRAIRKRRAIYNRLMQEAKLNDHGGRGMSFTGMLFLLAHHKLVNDRDALGIAELDARDKKNRLVTDEVNRDRVSSLFRTILLRRKWPEMLTQYRKEKMEQHAQETGQDIPAIVVESLPDTPIWGNQELPLPLEPTSPHHSLGSPASDRRFSANAADSSLVVDPSGTRLQRSNRRTSDMSITSYADSSFRSPRVSVSEEDPDAVLESMQTSQWGDLMMQAAQEEGRR